jgi:hypothetical protein
MSGGGFFFQANNAIELIKVQLMVLNLQASVYSMMEK